MHSLILGSLDLDERMPTDDGYSFAVLAEGVSFGSMPGVREVIKSLLSDGELVRTTRYGNREVTFDVEIEGPTLDALALGEAALRRELGRPNTLTWTAPDLFAAPTVFDVLDSEMSQTFDDLDELRRKRTFRVTLTCAPFARSAELTTFQALDTTGTPETIIDTCDSATGWTGAVNGVPFNPPDDDWLGTTGRLYAYDLFNPGPQLISLTRTGTVSLTGTPYIRVNVHSNEPELTTASAVIDGVPTDLDLISKRKSPTSSVEYEFLFKIPSGATSLSSLTVSNYSYADFAAFGVSEVARSGSPTDKPHRVSRILEIGGTERTTGSIEVASSDAADLWVTLIHTSPASDLRGSSGYSPSMRPYRTSGNTTTTDAARFSGFSEPLEPNPFVAQVQNVALPDGPYFVAAMVKSDTTGTFRIYWTVRTITDNGSGVDIVGEEERSATFAFTAGIWSFVPLGIISLPVAQAANAVTRFDIQSDVSESAVLTLDDAYLFWAAEGCGLTVLSTAQEHVWLDTPDTASPVPTYWTGTNADRSDAYHPGDALLVPGSHPLLPGQMRVWVATLGTTYPDVSATYYKRWHSNAAE